MVDATSVTCQTCFYQVAGSSATNQWFTFCRCDRPYLPTSHFSINFCANCKRKVAAFANEPVTHQNLCNCVSPNAMTIPSQLKANESDVVLLDLATVRMPADYFPSDKYTPLAFLGDTPRAMVLLCREKQRGGRVAVKLFKSISPSMHATFEGEVRKNKQLSHTNIAKILDFGIHNGKTPYVVTEYKEGFNVEECLSLYGPPSYDVAVKILIAVCETLGYAQKQGILHRDIRPGNIIFLDDTNSEPSVCLMDFSFPKVKASEKLRDPWFARFMSGDEARGLDYTEKSEIYCLGSIGYLLLTARPPFTDGTALEIKNSHALKLPPRISSIKFSNERPGDLDEVIEKCLEKDPKDRFESVAKFQERLEVFPRRIQMRIANALAARRKTTLLKIAGGAIIALAVCAAVGFALMHH